MNAEVDIVLGYLLRNAALKQNVIVTSDAGDQHGVLARMIEEIEMCVDMTIDGHRQDTGEASESRDIHLVRRCIAIGSGADAIAPSHLLRLFCARP